MAEPNDRFINGEERPDDQIDRALRPTLLREMIGQIPDQRKPANPDRSRQAALGTPGPRPFLRTARAG